MTRIMCLSDTHGTSPVLDLDGIDLVLHAGDFLYREKKNYADQLIDFEKHVCPWIESIAKKCQVFFTLGNHETFWQAFNLSVDYNDITKNHLLLDTGVIIPQLNNLSVWGFPYTNRYGNWGFNVDDTPDDMGRLAGHICTGINIVLSHGPVYGINDHIDYPYPNHAGSKELGKRINELTNLKLFVSGHLHDDRNYGVIDNNGVKYVGCSITNELYEHIRQPIIVELD